MLVLLLSLLLFGGFYVLLFQRKVPALVMQIWFCIHLGIGITVNALICFIMRKLAEKKFCRTSLSQCICRVVSVYCFSWSRLMCPHIQLKEMPNSLNWKSVTGQHAFCLNHASFFDTVLTLWLVPPLMMWSAKTFSKASLEKLPLLRELIKGCGQFPVYFNSEKGDNFSVDKELQMKVNREVEEFVSGTAENGQSVLKSGGSLLFFCEGAMNRCPETLATFRLGSFQTMLKHRLPLYFMVFYGSHKVWPTDGKVIPGLPADIYYFIGKYDYDPASEDAKSLSEGLRSTMQKHLDDIMARRAVDAAVVGSPEKLGKSG